MQPMAALRTITTPAQARIIARKAECDVRTVKRYAAGQCKMNRTEHERVERAAIELGYEIVPQTKSRSFTGGTRL